MSFEDELKRLEEITEKLKDEKTPLEEAVSLYEEAGKLTKILNKKLSSIERKIEIITSESEDELESESYAPTEEK